MTTKNTNFATKINQIIKEEAQAIVNENLPSKKNKKQTFEAWALAKLKQDYGDVLPASVNEKNIVDFLSGSKFKLSPEEFEARKSVNTSYNAMLNQFKIRNRSPELAKNIGDVDQSDEEEEELPPTNGGKVYRSGEMPLDDIARELGGITKMGVSKKIDDALGKLMRFGVDREGENNLTNQINVAREAAANDYLNLLMASRGNINAFLKALEASKLTRLALDVGQVSQTEIKALKQLYETIKANGNDKELGKEMLISDLEDNDPSERIWQTFQAVVARKANVKKKKNSSDDED